MKNKLIFVTLCIFLVLLSGLRSVGLDNDSLNYVGILNTPFHDIGFNEKEPAFLLILHLNQLFLYGDSTSFFLVFALVGVVIKFYAISKTSIFPILSLFVYFCLYFVLHEMTQIRVGVASGLFILAVRDYVNQFNYRAFLKILCAALFHYSALIGLCIFIISRCKFSIRFYFFLPIAGVFFLGVNFVSVFEFLAHYLPSLISEKIILYCQILVDGKFSELNPINFYYTVIFVAYLYLVVNSKLIKRDIDLFFLKLWGVGLFSFYFLSSVPVLAFRTSEFFCVVLIPLLGNIYYYVRGNKIYLCSLLFFCLAVFASQGIAKNLNFEVYQ